MRRFLQKELNKVNKIMSSHRNEEYVNAERTKDEIIKIISNFYEEEQETVSNNFRNIYDKAMKIIFYFSELSLLETEFPMDYPILTTRRKIKIEDVITFINQLYSKELMGTEKPLISKSNLKIFRNPLFNKLSLKNNFVIYKQYYEGKKMLLLYTNNNVKDFIIPATKAIELYKYPRYLEKLNLIEYYLKLKSIDKLKETNYNNDCIDLELIDRDSLILTARLIRNLIGNCNYEDLDNEMKLVIQDFVDNILAIELSRQEGITLHDISLEPYDDIILNINSVNETELYCSDDEIMEKKRILKK